MTRLVAALVFVATLAACGADGPPQRPADMLPGGSSIVITGEARMGVVSNGG